MLSIDKTKTMKKIYLFLLMVLTVLFASAQTLIMEIEAETGILNGTILDSSTMASGGQFVTGFDADGDKVTITINVSTGGNYDLAIRYRSVYGDKVNDLYINGEYWSSINFAGTSDFMTANIAIVLNEGESTLEIVKSWGYVDIDKFSVYSKPMNLYNITTTLSDVQIDSNTQKLYDFIRSQYGHTIMTGETSDYYDEVVNIVGKRPLVRGFDLMTYTPMYPYKWDGSGHTFGAVDNGETDKVISWYGSTGKKGVVEIHWHWFSPSGGLPGTNTFSTAETTFDVSQAIIAGTPENLDVLRDIDAIAVQLKRISDAGIPVIWRPLHEAGGGWFWWGAKGPDPCLALWDIVRDRLTNYHGLHNLIWCWSTPEGDWYPGNEKLDILGFDSYPGAYNYTTQKAMFDEYHNLAGGAKIVAMTENGPIPELGDAIDLDARWSWFCAWNDLISTQNTTQHIIDMFNHQYALTIENCPEYQNESVNAPGYDPPSGEYSDIQLVSISSTTDGATIYFTTDGSAPTISSTIYNSPIEVTETTTIRAIAIKSGLSNSDITTGTYTIISSGFQVGGVYKLTARHSGKVMEVVDSSLENGALVQQYSDAGTDNQKWEFQDGGSGTFKLVALHSGKALDVSGSSDLEGASIVQRDLQPVSSQQWNIVSVGDGYFKIENVNSGKVLGFSSKRKNNGINVEQYDYIGEFFQQWIIELISLKSAHINKSSDEFLNEVYLNDIVRLFPNPARDIVNVDLSNFADSTVSIEVIGMNGTPYKFIQVSGGSVFNMDLSELKAGFYFIRVIDNGQRFTRKLVVE